MYTNLTRAQGFPRVAKISSGFKCFQSSHALKTQYLPFCSTPTPSLSHMLKNPNFCSHKASNKIGSFCLMNPVKHSTELLHGTLEMGKLVSCRQVSYGLPLKISGCYCFSLWPRSWSTSYAGKVNEGINVGRAGKQLPWLVSNEAKEAKESGKTKMTNIGGSIQEESAKKEKEFGNSSAVEESLKRSGKVNYRSSWEESIPRLENLTMAESGHSSYQAAAGNFSKTGDISAVAIKGSRNGS
ncbi:uncharacterized protein LOC129301689, partial [Prosopis cineraria]|uniref:uncharacterized protein LOC129301689 n=1 Tax=Prosopis cineraria TaxID=364024 RepID=UPI00240F820F